MRNLPKLIFILLGLLFLGYLALPDYSFPAPPPDSLQSNEPADSETALRRAYFTNATREEVMNHYKAQFNTSAFLGLRLPTYRLNYPPEEAQSIIRDQTRSTFLEEITHPFRESIYINGYEPKDPNNAVFIEGRLWRQKIIVKSVPSNIPARLGIGVMVLTLLYLVFKVTLDGFKALRLELKGKYA